ncbi:MAG: CsoS2 family carboxysome shell protein [Pseudomonadota bacterium]
MVPTNPSAAEVTLSGRELALMRRQALARHGKAGVASATQVQASRAASNRRAAAASACPCNGGCSPKGCSAKGCASVVCDCATRDAASGAASALQSSAAASSMTAAAGAALPPGSTTRELARQRRTALACEGKAGLRRESQGTLATTASRSASSAWPSSQGARVQVAPAGASGGRMAASRRRQARATQGRSDGDPSAAARPSGRVRPNPPSLPAPSKVGLGHTLSGRPVTGTLLDATTKLTGAEAGQCRPITGTEYLGSEPFESVCGTRPPPAPTKVGVTHTQGQQKVTGTEVGRSARVTGDETGACRGITGTEYLAREQLESLCDGPAPAPRKASVLAAPRGLALSGTATEHDVKVTGSERGASRQLTGTSYANSASVAAAAPPKVAEQRTRAGSAVTGTDPGLSAHITGNDHGRCHAVTGTEHVGPRELQAVCETVPEVQAVAKVGHDQTWRGLAITGTQVMRSERVTGDEHGACAAVSGTPYIGRKQYEGYCEAPQRDSQLARFPVRASISASVVTGDRPGAGGSLMTGDERGACGTVSGTPYVGVDNAPRNCPPVVERYVQRARLQPELPSIPAPTDFSIVPPARQARERCADGLVTGSALGTRRITGPVNKARDLITGTPEFRHSEAAAAALPTDAAAAPAADVARAATRLTGEGGQSGARVSGDAWTNSGRVTGTEGASAQARNPSQRGQPRGSAMNAARMREVERPQPAPSPVTGSAGSTSRGAAVTVSGGARA